jgi:hypothetical protein
MASIVGLAVCVASIAGIRNLDKAPARDDCHVRTGEYTDLTFLRQVKIASAEFANPACSGPRRFSTATARPPSCMPSQAMNCSPAWRAALWPLRSPTAARIGCSAPTMAGPPGGAIVSWSAGEPFYPVGADACRADM